MCLYMAAYYIKGSYLAFTMVKIEVSKIFRVHGYRGNQPFFF